MDTTTNLFDNGVQCRHRVRVKTSPVNVAATAGGKMMAYAASALLLLTLSASPAHAALTEVAAILNPTPDAADAFGVDVAIDGDLAIVGAYQESTDANNANPKPNAGAAYIYQRVNGQWGLVQKLVSNDRHKDQRFGSYVAISGGARKSVV